MKGIHQKIATYKQKQELVKVQLVNQNIYGYIISTLDSGFILAQFLDFHFEGYMFITTNSVLGISDKGQKIYQETLEKKLKVVKKNILIKYNKCNTFEQLYEKILTKLCIMELIGSSDWLFGGIVSQKNSHIVIREFSALGKRHRSKRKIELEDIIFVQRDTEYLNVYAKHILELR